MSRSLKKISILTAILNASTLLAQDGAGPAELDGLITPSETVELACETPGVVDEILFDRGARVNKEDVVARLRMGVVEATIRLAKAQVSFAQRKVSRNESLAAKNMISSHEADEIETELQLARLRLEEAQVAKQLRFIKSPVSGVIIERLSAPGENVGEKHIMSIAQLDPLFVEVTVPMQMYGAIKVGMNAELTLEDPVSLTREARIKVIDAVIDAASGTFGVRLELPNPDLALPAGIKCKVRFPGASFARAPETSLEEPAVGAAPSTLPPSASPP